MAETNFLTVFMFFSPVVICTWLASSMQKNPKRLKLFFCILIASLVAGLRANTVGNDTIGYFRMFDSYGEWGFIREPAFLLYIKLFMGITHSAQACVFITSFITNGLILAGFWKMHDHVNFPSMVFAYMCIPFFLTMSGMRQWLSLSIVFFGFHFILEKKYIRYLFVVMIAVMFHYSSIVAITYLGIAILLSNTGKLNLVKLIQIMAILLICAVAIVAGYVLVNSEYQSYINIPEYESRTGLLTSLRFLVFGIFVAATLVSGRRKRNQLLSDEPVEGSIAGEPDETDKLITTLAAVGFLLWTLSAFASQYLLNVARIGWVFLMSEALLFSRFTKERSNLHTVGKYAMILILLYTLYKTATTDTSGLIPYSFFWMRQF